MSISPTPGSKTKTGIIKKVLVILSAAVLTLVFLLVGFVIFLPKLISTERFKGFVENRASIATNRRVQIGALRWERADEILIDNISLGDDPAFSSQPMLLVKGARIKIFFSDIIDGRLHLDVAVDGVEAGFIREKSGQTNVGLLLAQFEPAETAETEPLPVILKNMSFSVPLDIQARVHLDHIFIRAEDRIRDKRLALQDAAVRLDIPSLYLEPITLTASAAIDIDGSKAPPFSLNILIKNLVNPEGKLRVTDTDIEVKGTCPGAEWVFAGSLNTLKMNGRAACDLLKFSKILETFIAPRFLPAEIAGNLSIVFNGSANPQASIAYSATLEGQGIVLSKGVLGDKTLGPLGFTIMNQGVLDAVKARLSIEKGELAFLQKSGMVWNGEVQNIFGTAPEANVNFGSIRFDIGELLDPFKKFIPQGVKFSGKTRNRFPILEITNANFSGPLPSGPNQIRVNGLVLKIPDVRFAPGEFQGILLSATGVRLAVTDLRSTLKEFFPAQLSLTAALITDSIYIKGTKDIHVKKLSVPMISVISNDIHRSKNPLIGLTGRFKIQDTLTADAINIPSLITINNFQKSMEAALEFPSDTSARLAVKDLKIDIPELIFADSTHGPFITNAKLDGRIDEISFPGSETLNADIKGIKSHLLVDNVLVADIEADAENMGWALLKAKGTLLINMVPFSEKFIAKVYDKLTLTGRTSVNWDFTGRLPKKKQIHALISPSINVKDDLDFIDRFDASCSLKDMGVDLAVSEDMRLKVGSVSTGPSLRYSFDAKTGKGKMDGEILLQGLQKVPFRRMGDTRLSAEIIVSGEHNHLESATFSQVMELKPANINQTFELSLTGMDRIVQRNLKMRFPLWLKYLGGTARGTLEVSEKTNLAMLVENLKFEGRLRSGLELLLVPGESVRLNAWASSPEMNVSLGEFFNVKGLKTDLNFEKEYRIIEEEKIKADQKKMMPLSVSVLKAESEPAAGSAFEFDTQDAAVTTFMGELQNRFSTRHAVAFTSAYWGLGPLPLSVDRSVIDFNLNKGLPGSDYFQVDVLGGTMIGSVAVLRSNDIFFLQPRLAFSDVNTAKINPAAGTKDTDDSALSGQLWARIPLASLPSSLLSEFQMSLNLSRIGSRSLERFLYALDPSESNEVIVSQRQLLRLGFPRWIHVDINDGNLSLDGEVDVKGVSVAIPSLRRLNVANLAGVDNYVEYLAGLVPLIEALNIFSANVIKIGKNGEYLKFSNVR
ncbi:MAG: hypothetical protein ABIK98_03875 [Pseudomonadota bacterium]